MKHTEPHRIFAYGSLMWRPDFEFLSVRPAHLHGFHRRLCVFSHHYRGTEEKPGLVLGLDKGGSCQGVVYDVARESWARVIEKVRKREMLGDVYREAVLSFHVAAGEPKVSAITYVVRHQSEQFAPKMGVAELMRFISQGEGTMGSCRAYVASTIRHLRELKIHDTGLEQLAPHVL